MAKKSQWYLKTEDMTSALSKQLSAIEAESLEEAKRVAAASTGIPVKDLKLDFGIHRKW